MDMFRLQISYSYWSIPMQVTLKMLLLLTPVQQVCGEAEFEVGTLADCDSKDV